MDHKKDIVKRVLDYMEENMEEEISVDEIAGSVGYSKFYLNRIFSEYTGITIYKYLQSRRLTIAAEKLVKTDAPVMQIAFEAGYDSQQSFPFAFKQLYSCPPQIYRSNGMFVPKQDKISLAWYFCNAKYLKAISDSRKAA